MFRTIEQGNCFIIQHTDNKAQIYCRKAGGAQNYVYRGISVDSGDASILCAMTIFGHCYNVLNTDSSVCGVDLDSQTPALPNFSSPPFFPQSQLTQGKTGGSQQPKCFAKQGITLY